MNTLNKFRIGIMVILMLGLTTSVFATAPPPTFNGADFGCSTVTFSYTGNGSPVSYRVVDGDGDVVSNTQVGQTTGTHSMTLTLSPEQEQGTTLQVQHNYLGWNDFGPATACAGEGQDNQYIALPWEYFGGEDAYAAFRFIEDIEGNPVLVFLSVDNDGEGSLLFYISEKMLDADFPCTGEQVQIFSSDDGLYQLWRLPDCQLQANVGPDAEGKIHVIGFSEIPPGDDIFTYTLVGINPLNLFASLTRLTDIVS